MFFLMAAAERVSGSGNLIQPAFVSATIASLVVIGLKQFHVARIDCRGGRRVGVRKGWRRIAACGGVSGWRLPCTQSRGMRKNRFRLVRSSRKDTAHPPCENPPNKPRASPLPDRRSFSAPPRQILRPNNIPLWPVVRPPKWLPVSLPTALYFLPTALYFSAGGAGGEAYRGHGWWVSLLSGHVRPHRAGVF